MLRGGLVVVVLSLEIEWIVMQTACQSMFQQNPSRLSSLHIARVSESFILLKWTERKNQFTYVRDLDPDTRFFYIELLQLLSEQQPWSLQKEGKDTARPKASNCCAFACGTWRSSPIWQQWKRIRVERVRKVKQVIQTKPACCNRSLLGGYHDLEDETSLVNRDWQRCWTSD